MAPLPVIDDCFRCTLRWQHTAGQTAVNVIHVHDVSGGKTASDIFTDLDTFVSAQMWATVDNGASVANVDILKLDGVSATQSFPTGSPGKWQGVNGGDHIPAVAVLVKLQTGLRGRSHRGRIFLPFTAEGQQSDGTINPATVADAQAAWDDFIDGMNVTAQSPLVVASYLLADDFQVSAFTVEGVTATQRRRQSRLR